MNERSYRRRLRADLETWVGDGRLTADAAEAVRAALGPDPKRAGAAHYAAIAGVVLLGAAVLVFVAANWQAVPRLGRLGLLTGLIAAAFAAGGWAARAGRSHVADLAATLGCIAFGATIALVGQMYHLPKDLAGGLFLWAMGALVAAALTGSRGAFAVAAASGFVWTAISGVGDGAGVPWAFWPFWTALAALALVWENTAARHLSALAFFGWWGVVAVHLLNVGRYGLNLAPQFTGAALGLGLALLVEAYGGKRLRAFAAVFADYAVFATAFALASAMTLGVVNGRGVGLAHWPAWMVVASMFGGVALLAASLRLRPWQAPAAYAGALALTALMLQFGSLDMVARGALALAAAVLMLIAGASGDRRPRLVAGWLAFAAVVAYLVWSLGGGLLDRALLLALASFATMGVAALLRKFSKEGGAA